MAPRSPSVMLHWTGFSLTWRAGWSVSNAVPLVDTTNCPVWSATWVCTAPLVFILYTANLIDLIERHSLHSHLYAFDTQIQGSCHLGSACQLQSTLSACLDEVSWLTADKSHKLNSVTTEILWCLTTLHQNHSTSADVCVRKNHVLPSATVCDLGIFIDSGVAMWSHVFRCFAVLRQLRSIRCSVFDCVFHLLVVSLVMPRLNCGSATLAGLHVSQLLWLQSVLIAVARLIHRSFL